jgi:hypothetical protein
MKRLTNATERLQARFVPTGYTEVFSHADGSAVYVQNTANGGIYAMGFIGTAYRPKFNYSFRSLQQREEFVRGFIDGKAKADSEKAARKAAKAAWTNSLKVGEILYTCWGYDQTNTEFYVVTKVSGRKVTLAQIAADYSATGDMTGKTWPAMPVRITGEELVRIAQPCGDRVRVKISSCVDAWPEQGRVHSVSSYA